MGEGDKREDGVEEEGHTIYDFGLGIEKDKEWRMNGKWKDCSKPDDAEVEGTNYAIRISDTNDSFRYSHKPPA
ncbi:MAG: hypothetical protein AMXMBFR60_28760 [Chloroflexota bacterium]